MVFVKNSRGGRDVTTINTVSKINLSKIGWEGEGSTSIWIISLNILFVFFDGTPYNHSLLQTKYHLTSGRLHRRTDPLSLSGTPPSTGWVCSSDVFLEPGSWPPFFVGSSRDLSSLLLLVLEVVFIKVCCSVGVGWPGVGWQWLVCLTSTCVLQ